jgi:endonuclease III
MPVSPKKVFSVFRKNYTLVPLEIFKKDPFKTLISTLLSARTRDETTLEASYRLFKKAPDIKTLGLLKELEIRKLIYPVGFYKTKARHLKKLTQKINKVFKGKIPHTKKDLISLPGVGIKTANLVLNRAFDIPAIAVDTHVHTISNFLGWVKTKNPEATEKQLSEILPRRYWSEINMLFVSIGRKFKTKKKVYEFLKKEGLI